MAVGFISPFGFVKLNMIALIVLLSVFMPTFMREIPKTGLELKGDDSELGGEVFGDLDVAGSEYHDDLAVAASHKGHKWKKGGGEEHHSDHHASKGEKGDKGYKGNKNNHSLQN